MKKTTHRMILKKVELTLDSHEYNVLKMAVDYVWHRLKKHPGKGLDGKIDAEAFDRLRKQL